MSWNAPVLAAALHLLSTALVAQESQVIARAGRAEVSAGEVRASWRR